MTTVDTLVKAIEVKKAVAFSYHGHDRVASPYACGLNGTNELKLVALQTDGGSTSGVTRKLRWYTIEDILGLELSDAPYEAPDATVEDTVAQFLKLYARY